MKNLLRCLAILLIARDIATFECPSMYKDECNCRGKQDSQTSEMTCYGPEKNVNSENSKDSSINFKISIRPRKNVQIQCYKSSDWSHFHYDISTKVRNSNELFFMSCRLEKNTSLSEIAKLTGSETVEILHIKERAENEHVISKLNFQGFPNLKHLAILRNPLHQNLSEDILEYIPKLTRINLSQINLKVIPENIFQNVPELEYLTIIMNSIKSIAPNTFKNLKKLKSLFLVSNEIDEIKPYTFDDLISLQDLRLRDNKLQTLPENIFEKLVNLREVVLSKNLISSIPKNIFENNCNIIRINLEHNQLTSLPNETFRKLSNLQNILINSNKLNELPADLFRGLSSLESINIGNNFLQTLPSGVFEEVYNLKSIMLRNNTLNELPADLFRGLSSLEVINLEQNFLRTLPEDIFDGLNNLKTLTLSYNQLTIISSTLLKGLEALQGFKADSNQIQTVEKDAFETLVNLRKIDLSYNKITILEGKRELFHGSKSLFSECDSLEELNLSNNDISKIDNDWIISATPTFTILDLSHNNISSLSVNLSDFEGTKNFRIDLSDNIIQKVYLHGLESGLDNECHVTIDLSNNPIYCDWSVYESTRYLNGLMPQNISHVLDFQIKNVKCDTSNQQSKASSFGSWITIIIIIIIAIIFSIIFVIKRNK